MDCVFDFDDGMEYVDNYSSSGSSDHSCGLTTPTRYRFHTCFPIKKLFRILEFSFLLLFFVWVSSRLPLAVRISGEYFRLLVDVVLSHFFIFLLSNSIVLTLVLKSRKLNNVSPDLQKDDDAHLDYCREFIGDVDGVRNRLIDADGEKSPLPDPEEVMYQDKQMILEVRKVVRRSQSENLRKRSATRLAEKQQLRRWETERPRRRREVVEELSNEDFKREIEAFIAKQIKFHREEKLAIVVHGR